MTDNKPVKKNIHTLNDSLRLLEYDTKRKLYLKPCDCNEDCNKKALPKPITKKRDTISLPSSKTPTL